MTAITCTDRACRYAPERHQAFALCDEDGIVRKGAMHHGTDYECTGHAHFGGFHITCTSRAHPNAPVGDKIYRDQRAERLAFMAMQSVVPVGLGNGSGSLSNADDIRSQTAGQDGAR